MRIMNRCISQPRHAEQVSDSSSSRRERQEEGLQLGQILLCMAWARAKTMGCSARWKTKPKSTTRGIADQKFNRLPALTFTLQQWRMLRSRSSGSCSTHILSLLNSLRFQANLRTHFLLGQILYVNSISSTESMQPSNSTQPSNQGSNQTSNQPSNMTANQISDQAAEKTQEKKTISFEIGQEVYVSDLDKIVNRGPFPILRTSTDQSGYYIVKLPNRAEVQARSKTLQHDSPRNPRRQLRSRWDRMYTSATRKKPWKEGHYQLKA